MKKQFNKTTISKATTDDAEILTNITKKSKSHWGYSNEQIESWSSQLTITTNYIETNKIYKLVINELVVGYYSYVILEENVVQLDNLFVLPEYIGTGLGTFLMNDFLDRCKALKFQKVVLDADPNAENFYKKRGFKTIGQIETSIKDRFLPIMELHLDLK
jgi:N-acetylglutamate synthase-like GNAT family acetyltransferase